MDRDEAARAADVVLPHLSVDDDCGQGATSRLYAQVMEDIWPSKTNLTDDDVARFVIALMRFAGPNAEVERGEILS